MIKVIDTDRKLPVFYRVVSGGEETFARPAALNIDELIDILERAGQPCACSYIPAEQDGTVALPKENREAILKCITENMRFDAPKPLPRFFPTEKGAILGDRVPQKDFRCRVICENGDIAYFDEAECTAKPYYSGFGAGETRIYAKFKDHPELAFETRVWQAYTDGEVRCELIPLKDANVNQILWPAPYEHVAVDGQTALPIMQGLLLPNYGEKPFDFMFDMVPCERSMTMRFFAQYDAAGGYVAFVDTFYDCALHLSAEVGQPVSVSPEWLPQLGKCGEARVMRLRTLPKGADYNNAARLYRDYIRSRGELVTLKEKIARKPALEAYLDMPICHTDAYIHIVPESDYYRPDDPAFNDRIVPFDVIGEKFRRLRAMGVEKLSLHLDGWVKRGYDNLHPDILPPAPVCGGTEGLKRLKATCHELGYKFGIHDQYRDYYFDDDSFDEDNVAVKADGTREEHSVWYGGAQTTLCAKVARDYVRRNYDWLDANGLRPDNAYLDVFSVVQLDECANPAHRMTREDCAMARAKCFEDVSARGIVLQSEELVDWALPYMDYVHHEPFALAKFDHGDFVGVPVPLQHLVYHDCLIVPYFQRGGDPGVPKDMDGAMMSLLYGCASYIDADADETDIERMKLTTRWQKQVQLKAMLKHTVLADGKRRCDFEDGYSAEVDFNTGAYRLTFGEGGAVETGILPKRTQREA